MRPEQYPTSKLVQWLEKERILTLDRVAEALGRPARITLFRKLAQLGSRASYSHGGRYHTLDRIADYDEDGLWSFRGVQFSQHGTLGETIVSVVEDSEAGCFASELQTRLQVRVHNALAQVHGAGRLSREQLDDQYLYLSPRTGAEQLQERYERRQRAQASGSAEREELDELGESMRWLLTVLDEQQRRLYLGLESLRVGRGGDRQISRMSGVNVKTIASGRRQLQQRQITTERLRAVGAGRPPLKKTEVIALLDEVMQADTAGDPTNDQKWSRKDTRSISQQMKERGLAISPKTVGQLLQDQNYALRVNRKSIAQTQHPERNRQFELIEDFRKQFEDADAPILSLDTKKKELIGNFRNPGQAWSQEPEEVNQHDFRSQASALAAPYGLYEPVPNRGTIIIGLSADTPEFAVDCLETWICQRGWAAYPRMKEILLLCDSGGSNGYRPRFWKYGLYQTIARGHGLTVRVCHYPPGASKWNPVEHRLFSFISLEWAGHPLRSLELMKKYIEGTTTKTGLEVTALVNEREYTKGKKLSNRQFKEIPLSNHSELPAWNYTIGPN